MRVLLIITLILLTVLLPRRIQEIVVAENMKPQEASQEEAKKLWEQAIAAKGGHKRLYEVHNLVVSSHAKYKLGFMKSGQQHFEEFYVFPNKSWLWFDERPSKLGLAVKMNNLDRNLFFLTYPDDPESPRKLGVAPEEANSFTVRAQLLYLMETQWIKPVPVKVTRGRINGKAVNIVHTFVRNRQVDFALDPESHLPVNVTIHYRSDKDVTSSAGVLPIGESVLNSVALSDYAEVNGIQIPHTINFDQGVNSRTSYQMNVAYDERIFERPPIIEAGPEAWREAKR